LRSRYDPARNPESWPADTWLAQWWHTLTGPRRWLAGTSAALAVIAGLAVIAATAGLSGPPARAGTARAGTARTSANRTSTARTAPARTAVAPRTSCRSVVHIGDSTSADLISLASIPDPAQRLAAQYRDVGVTHVRIDASGGRSVVEALPGQVNGYNVAAGQASGYRGCWVIALGTNDAADVAAGSSIGLQARIQEMMSAAHGQPVLWVNTRTLLTSGPWSEANEAAFSALLRQDLARYPNLHIYNWAAVAQPPWFLPDGIHYTPAGCAIRARDIAAALARAFPARGHGPRIVS
jgi:hypothetical protein